MDRPPEPPAEGPPTPDESVTGPDWTGIAREVAISIGVVLLVAGLLFGVSGVWPPLVAVVSDSMEPQIMTGDLVFVIDNDRFAHEAAIPGTGVVPADRGAEVDHEAFDRPGDVIIFASNGGGDMPIIHRAHLWVEEGENWYARGDPALLGSSDSCGDITHCPAPHAGFITHGDNNRLYDQVRDDNQPVKPEWIVGRARLRIPVLGRIRLFLDELLSFALPALPGLAL